MNHDMTTTFHNGIKIPLLGFGVFQMESTTAERSVLEAIQAGYRHIDTAAIYGNEAAVGSALKKSGIKREEMFITTKLWIQDATYQDAKRAFQKSLHKLGVDYVDLYLIHQPFGDVHGAWHALEELYEEGVVKAIGVSNFSPIQIRDLIHTARIIPMINQIETHPFNQQTRAHTFLDTYGIVHEGWAPLAEGEWNIFGHEVLRDIAKKHQKSVAQIVLRWNIQRGVVAIPKSKNPDRIKENIDIFNFELSDADMRIIAGIDMGESLIDEHDPAYLDELYQHTVS